MDHVFSVQAMVRGYHYYKAIWEAAIDGEVLSCEREVGNVHDTFAVSVKKDGIVVGHCPRKISSLCSIFIRRGGSITCQVNGNRRYSQDLPQGGLEVPCILTFRTSKKAELDKTERLITNALSTEIKLPEVPLLKLPIGLDSTAGNSFNNCASELKIKSEPTQINDNATDDAVALDSEIPVTDDQPPAKKQKLSSKEVEDIIMGNELSDLQINMAQNLLKAQFPCLKGLKSTLLQEKQQTITEDEVNNKLQIIHCFERHHWIVATTVNCASGQVNVFDSLFKALDNETKATISRLFQRDTNSVIIKVMNSQKQMGVKDCGLFSIAFATAIAFGQNPTKQMFQQQSMRAHLVNCFENKKMTPFP